MYLTPEFPAAFSSFSARSEYSTGITTSLAPCQIQRGFDARRCAHRGSSGGACKRVQDASIVSMLETLIEERRPDSKFGPEYVLIEERRADSKFGPEYVLHKQVPLQRNDVNGTLRR